MFNTRSMYEGLCFNLLVAMSLKMNITLKRRDFKKRFRLQVDVVGWCVCYTPHEQKFVVRFLSKTLRTTFLTYTYRKTTFHVRYNNETWKVNLLHVLLLALHNNMNGVMQKRLRILFKRKIKARNRIHFVLLHIRHPISQTHDTCSFPIPSIKVYQSILQYNQDAFINITYNFYHTYQQVWFKSDFTHD